MHPDHATDDLQISIAQIGATHSIEVNLNRVLGALKEAASNGTQLIIFPECILTGYMYDSPQETQNHSLRLGGPEIQTLLNACVELRINAVVGLLEDQGPGIVKNAAAFLSESGAIEACYRKIHLPGLGADRFVTEGERTFPIVETAFGRIAMNICYDLRFPECARVAALDGADLIAQPSTMPPEASALLEHFTSVRAAENRVFLALANRGDEEAGISFIGRSQLVDPTGSRIVEAPSAGDSIITASIQLKSARQKRIVNVPGEYEVSLFEDRRPIMYTAITKSKEDQ